MENVSRGRGRGCRRRRSLGLGILRRLSRRESNSKQQWENEYKTAHYFPLILTAAVLVAGIAGSASAVDVGRIALVRLVNFGLRMASAIRANERRVRC